MGYEKQTFLDEIIDENGNTVQDGTVLTADHLNHIEDGIVANENELKNKQPKGNYLTEHQKIKTINGQSLVGGGDLSIGGLTAEAKQLLIAILKNAVYTSDQTENITLLEEELDKTATSDSPPIVDPPVEETNGVTQVGSVLRIIDNVNAVQNGNTLTIM